MYQSTLLSQKHSHSIIASVKGGLLPPKRKLESSNHGFLWGSSKKTWIIDVSLVYQTCNPVIYPSIPWSSQSGLRVNTLGEWLFLGWNWLLQWNTVFFSKWFSFGICFYCSMSLFFPAAMNERWGRKCLPTQISHRLQRNSNPYHPWMANLPTCTIKINQM